MAGTRLRFSTDIPTSNKGVDWWGRLSDDGVQYSVCQDGNQVRRGGGRIGKSDRVFGLGLDGTGEIRIAGVGFGHVHAYTPEPQFSRRRSEQPPSLAVLILILVRFRLVPYHVPPPPPPLSTVMAEQHEDGFW